MRTNKSLRSDGFHHLAIATPDPARLAQFYAEVIGLTELRRMNDEQGLRSVWFSLSRAGGSFPGILMLERSNAETDGPGIMKRDPSPYRRRSPGFHLLALSIRQSDAFQWKDHLNRRGIQIEDESDFTLYVRDPDGNRVGLSWYDLA